MKARFSCPLGAALLLGVSIASPAWAQRAAPPEPFPLASSFVKAFPNVQFNYPMVVAMAPGDPDHVFVAGLGGFIWVIDNDPATATKTLYLDLSDRTRGNGEQGLLGFAFDPDYATNGYVYAYYSDNKVPAPVPNGDMVIARYTANVAARTADRNSEIELLRAPHPTNNHNGGQVLFAPDGTIYVGFGDGGAPHDDTPQRLDNLLGKIIRINKDGTIPADNPFVGAGPGHFGETPRSEIWAYGFRNPFRFSIDAPTGKLWVGDVGASTWEEIDQVVKGGNYGWSRMEGTDVFDAALDAPNALPPLYQYGRTEGFVINGGRVYRGTAFPQLAGKYIYSDFGSHTVWALAESGGTVTSNQVIGSIPGMTSIGVDPDGEFLMTAWDWYLYKFAGTGDSALPQTLSETGLFTDLATMTPAAGVVEYSVNAPFWSDGAIKRRWLAIPGTTDTIAFKYRDPWVFPSGSMMIKHFEMDLADGSRKRLETRVLVNTDIGWQGYTYRWNDAGTEANLLPGGDTVTLEVPDATSPTGSRSQLYEFPDRSKCATCHNAAAGGVLGVKTRQLNGPFVYPSGTQNQIAYLRDNGYLDTDINKPRTLDRLPDPFDKSVALKKRARAYLDTNCSQCHRPGGPTGVNMDFRYNVDTAGMHTHNVPPAGDTFGIEGVNRITPGDHTKSLIWARMSAPDSPMRMPPIGSHVVDERGAKLIANWIDKGAN